MNNKLLRKKLICFALLIIFSVVSFGQSADFYKQKTLECLSNNECEKAQIMYDSYKDLSKRNDAGIEAAIKKCIDDKAIPVNPPVVETYLEISESNLSFNEKGEDEKSVEVKSNLPWVFSHNSSWIKATMTPDSSVINISCELNISRTMRKDSIIVEAGDKEKFIYIEQSEVADPLFTGKQMMDRGETGLAEKYFNLIIDSDNAEDWNKLAKIYVDMGEEEYYVKAFDLLQKSAAEYNSSGMCNLGYMHERGLGTKKDYLAAFRLYTLSAGQNYAPAQYNLGLMYEYGYGAKQDKKEARKWYEKAAEQGFSPALSKLNK